MGNEDKPDEFIIKLSIPDLKAKKAINTIFEQYFKNKTDDELVLLDISTLNRLKDEVKSLLQLFNAQALIQPISLSIEDYAKLIKFHERFSYIAQQHSSNMTYQQIDMNLSLLTKMSFSQQKNRNTN